MKTQFLQMRGRERLTLLEAQALLEALRSSDPEFSDAYVKSAYYRARQKLVLAWKRRREQPRPAANLLRWAEEKHREMGA